MFRRILLTGLLALFIAFVGSASTSYAQTMEIEVPEVENSISSPVSTIKMLGCRSIELCARPGKPFVSSIKDMIFIPDSLNNQIHIIKGYKSFPVLQNYAISTGANPVSVIVSNNFRRLYVLNKDDNTLSIYRFEGDETELITNVCTGNEPTAMAISPDNKYMYVTNTFDSTVSVFKLDDEETTLVSTICVGDSPVDIRLSRDGKTAYTVNQGENSITVIDVACPTGNILYKAVYVGNYPVGIVTNANTTHALVPNMIDKSLSLIDLISCPPLPSGQFDISSRPIGIDIDYDNHMVVVIKANSTLLELLDISAIDTNRVNKLAGDFISIPDEVEFLELNDNAKVIVTTHPETGLVNIINYAVELSAPYNPTPVAPYEESIPVNDLEQLQRELDAIGGPTLPAIPGQ